MAKKSAPKLPIEQKPTPEAVAELLKRLRDAETRISEVEKILQRYGLR